MFRKTLKIFIKIIILAFPLLFLAYAILLRSGLITIFKQNQPFEIIADMDNQKKIIPQGQDYFFDDSTTVRTPPENTVPLNGSKYHLDQTEYETAEKTLINPMKPDEINLLRGKNRFEVFCSPCHGFDGKGKGTVITKANLKQDEEGMPPPADLTSGRTKSLNDSRLFHILSAGQNLMFPVMDKMAAQDRWAIVLYIRKLQIVEK